MVSIFCQLIIIFYHYHCLRVFHTILSWWSFIGIWMRAILCKFSQYSNRSQNYCGLHGVSSFFDFQLFQSPSQAFWDHSKCTNYNWQSGFCRVYSNFCSTRSFEAKIIKIGLSSHNIYTNNILNFQESTTILNAYTKKVWKLIECTTYIQLAILLRIIDFIGSQSVFFFFVFAFGIIKLDSVSYSRLTLLYLHVCNLATWSLEISPQMFFFQFQFLIFLLFFRLSFCCHCCYYLL